MQIHEETGASVSTKGVWYPDRTKATEKDPPLYLHIAATTNEILQKAIAKVNELIAMDMGSLVEDKKDRLREKVSLYIHHLLCQCPPFCANTSSSISANGLKKNSQWGWRPSVTSMCERKSLDHLYVLPLIL